MYATMPFMSAERNGLAMKVRRFAPDIALGAAAFVAGYVGGRVWDKLAEMRDDSTINIRRLPQEVREETVARLGFVLGPQGGDFNRDDPFVFSKYVGRALLPLAQAASGRRVIIPLEGDRRMELDLAEDIFTVAGYNKSDKFGDSQWIIGEILDGEIEIKDMNFIGSTGGRVWVPAGLPSRNREILGENSRVIATVAVAAIQGTL